MAEIAPQSGSDLPEWMRRQDAEKARAAAAMGGLPAWIASLPSPVAPNGTPEADFQRALAGDPRLAGHQSDSANTSAKYDATLLGGIGRVLDSPLVKAVAPDPTNPLSGALGPLNELAGPVGAVGDVVTTGAKNVLSKLAPKAKTFSVAEAGAARLPVDAEQIAARIGAKTAAQEQTAAQLQRDLAVKRLEASGVLAPKPVARTVEGAPSNVIQFPKAPPPVEDLTGVKAGQQRIAELQKARADIASMPSKRPDVYEQLVKQGHDSAQARIVANSNDYVHPSGYPGQDLRRIHPDLFPVQTKAGPVTFAERGDAVGQEYHYTLTAMLDGKPAGYVSVANDTNGVAHVLMVEVPPELRRKGIASALVDRVRLESGGNVQMAGDFATAEGRAFMNATGKIETRASGVLSDLPKPTTGPSGAVPTFGFQIEKFPTDLQPFMQEVAAQNADKLAAKTGPITWAETVQHAQDIGEPVEQVAKRLAKRGVTSADLEMVREGVALKTRAAMATASKVALGQATPEEKLAALMNLQDAAAIQSSLHEAASEAGRTLNILRKQVDEALSMGPTEAAYQSAISRIARTPEKADEFFNKLLAIDPADTTALSGLLRDMNKADFWQKFDEYYKANLLWSPATHETNIVSGFYQQGLLLGDLALTKPKRVPDYVIGTLQGYKAAMDRIPAILAGAEQADKFGATIGREAIPGKLGNIIRIPFKALAIEDAFQTSPMFNGLVRVAAKEQGLKGDALRAFMKDPPIAVKAAALKKSEEFALHGDSQFASALLGLPRGLRYVMGAVFIKTPVNLAKLGTRFSPLGLARPVTERVLGQSKTPAAQLFRESAVIGGTLTAGFYGMLANDTMTGLYPKTKQEAAAWEAEGRGPLMIRASEYPILGPLFRAIHGEDASNRWYSAYMLGPLLWPALLASTARQVEQGGSEDPLDKQFAQAAAAIGRTVLDQIPLFQGMNRVNTLLADPYGAGVDYIGGLARGIMPATTLVATVERMTDNVRRDPNGVYETILAQIPGLSAQVNSKVDVLGNDVEQNSGALALLPRSSLEKVHPVIQEQERLAKQLGSDFTRLSKPTSSLGNVTLDPDELHRYAVLSGQETEKRLTTLINSKSYAGMSDADKSKQWAKEVTTARNNAKRMFSSELLGVDASQGGSARIPTTPTKEGKAVGLFLQSTTDKIERAQIIDNWSKSNTDPSFAAALGAALPKDGPSLDEYRQAYPLIQQVEKMPRFANVNGSQIGDETIWKQYDEEAKQFNAIDKRTDITAAGKSSARAAFRVTHPVFRQYEKYSPDNPVKSKLIKDNPVLSKFY